MGDQKFNEVLLDDPMFAVRHEGDAIFFYVSKSIARPTAKGVIFAMPIEEANKASRLLAEEILIARYGGRQVVADAGRDG